MNYICINFCKLEKFTIWAHHSHTHTHTHCMAIRLTAEVLTKGNIFTFPFFSLNSLAYILFVSLSRSLPLSTLPSNRSCYTRSWLPNNTYTNVYLSLRVILVVFSSFFFYFFFFNATHHTNAMVNECEYKVVRATILLAILLLQRRGLPQNWDNIETFEPSFTPIQFTMRRYNVFCLCSLLCECVFFLFFVFLSCLSFHSLF